MNKDHYAVIMAGGIGSRFWPMSKSKMPKQFLDILGTGETLIQQTYRRLKLTFITKNIYVVTNEMYIDLCIKQLSDLPESNILCEPIMRNTAPCIAYSVFKIHSINKNANIFIAASDHIITNEKKFTKILKKSLEFTSKNDIILTLGINPSRPDTGYGYIQFVEENLPESSEIKKVKTFTEKPSQDLALKFIDSGDFLWNSGMFISTSSSIILAYRKFLRDIYDVFDEGREFYFKKNEKEYIKRVFASCKNISIDYGIMEKAENVYVYPSDFGWSDLGTWSSLYTHLDLDKFNNAVSGNQVKLYNSHGNIVNVPNDKLVVINGLQDYIIVDNDGTLLICKKEDEQNIKQFVSDLKREGQEDKI